MRSPRVAEWILSQVLPADRTASTVGDWLEDATDRGPLWFWSCVLRTLLSRIWSDVAEGPYFLLGLGLRGGLYQLWLIAGTTLLGLCMLIPVVLVAGYLGEHLHWHPTWPLHSPWIAQVWICGLEFKTGRWIARRAPGREFAAGIVACLTPSAIYFPLGLLGQSVPMLPPEIFLLAGILWSRHISLRSVTP